jgi:hypothetical protein
MSYETTNQSQLINHDVNRAVAALRAGGFACLFSELIEPSLGSSTERLAGFPVRIHFTALPTESRGDPAPAFVTSTYWADPETYREDDGERTLRYASQWESDFSVEVTYCKDRRSWKGTKFCGVKAILWATGQDLRQFLIQLACRGVRDGELVLPIPEQMDLREMGVWGAYTFTPSPPIREASITSCASQHLPN